MKLIPLPTVNPKISNNPFPATSSTNKSDHHPTMDALLFHRSAFSTNPNEPGFSTGTYGGGGDAGGGSHDSLELLLGLVVVDLRFHVLHKASLGEETRGRCRFRDHRARGDEMEGTPSREPGDTRRWGRGGVSLGGWRTPNGGARTDATGWSVAGGAAWVAR